MNIKYYIPLTSQAGASEIVSEMLRRGATVRPSAALASMHCAMRLGQIDSLAMLLQNGHAGAFSACDIPLSFPRAPVELRSVKQNAGARLLVHTVKVRSRTYFKRYRSGRSLIVHTLTKLARKQKRKSFRTIDCWRNRKYTRTLCWRLIKALEYSRQFATPLLVTLARFRKKDLLSLMLGVSKFCAFSMDAIMYYTLYLLS